MKVLAKDLYKTLRESLGPELKAAGLRRLKMGMLGWTRPCKDKHLSVWFQSDRWGWFPDFGSSFTIEFQIDNVAGIGGSLMFGRARFMSLLSAEEREVVRSINNRILASIPPISPESPIALLGDKLQEGFLSSYRLSPEPYDPSQDVWLHYRRPENVAEWGDFFKPRMLRMIQQFESEFPKEYAS